MNPCALTDQLDAYLDGELTPEAARAFEAHAAHCPACADEAALSARVLAGLRALPAEPCPDDVFEAALARIAREAADRPAQPVSRARVPRWRVVGIGVTLLVLVAAALLLRRAPAEPSGMPAVAATDAPADPPAGAETPALTPPSPVAVVEPERPGVVTVSPPAAPAPRSGPRRRAPRPALSADPLPSAAPLAEAPPPAPADPRSPEAAAAREGALLALALVAEANQHAAEAVRTNVGDQLGHVSDALALAFPE